MLKLERKKTRQMMTVQYNHTVDILHTNCGTDDDEILASCHRLLSVL